MSQSISAVLKCNLYTVCTINNFLRHGSPFILPVRNLYAQKTLGVDSYIQSRERIKHQFGGMVDKFKTKMNDHISESDSDKPKNMVFTEDLKNMIHLAEANEPDVTLAINMMKKFNQQNKELRFGNFVFGPVVMRMFYFLNEPDKALECFKAPELQGFFDQLMSYQLLLDLLYENCKYDEVVKTFELIKSKQIQGTKYPKNIVVLTMAACYKMNTKDSLEYALKLWAELNSVGHLPMRRAATFCAGLALNQSKPDAALEIISNVRKQNYMTVRNIKTAALADLGRIDDLIQTLKSVLEIDDPNNIKHTFCKEVIDRARQTIEKQESATIKNDYQRIEKQLTEQGHIIDATLDQQLCSEIVSPPIMNNRNQQNMGNQSRIIHRNNYDPKGNNKYRVFNQRPGLTDMQ